MPTRRHVVSRLRQDLGESSADSMWFNRQLWDAYWQAAKLVIQRANDENKLVNQSQIFKKFNLDTEEVNGLEDTCVPLECISCRVKLPEKILHSKMGPIYAFLGSPDMNTQYVIVSPQEFIVKSKIKGTKARFACQDGDYLYLSKCIPCIQYLAFPDELMEGTGKCSIMDQEVPIPSYFEDSIIKLAKESLVGKQANYDHVANKNTQS